ncbi:MAG: lytic transglycosylase domain-containing protein [Terriglobales bacterium]
MSKLRFRAGSGALWLVVVCIVMLQTASAQVAPTQDPFGLQRANLMQAADKALADALADRPWMKIAASTLQPAANEPGQRLNTAVQRVQQLRPVVEPILSGEGVPPQLIAVALVESGGQAMALSPKGARGVWQFMPDTARRYGLDVSGERDERLELAKATRAAARYLRDLYQQFGDWELTFAAYNAGEQAVQRAMNRSGQRGYSAVQRFLPEETRNYVPAVVEAMRRFGGVPRGTTGSSTQKVLYAAAASGD